MINKKVKKLRDIFEEKFDDGETMIVESDNNLLYDVNNGSGDLAFRIGYLIWTLNGSNTLRSLGFHGGCMGGYTDDGETLRGAYGPRLRYWIGADALQEAIKINQDIDRPEDYIKPTGVDQVESVYNDLKSGLVASSMSIFDPSLDYESTRHVPDLHRVSFVKQGDKLNMNLNFLQVSAHGQMLNDCWIFMAFHRMMASMLDKKVGVVVVTVDSVMSVDGAVKDSLVNRVISTNTEIGVTADNFKDDYTNLKDFEKHLRMQMCNNTFTNEKVSIDLLLHTLKEKLLYTIESLYMRSLGYIVLATVIARHCDDIAKYEDHIIEALDFLETESKDLFYELVMYLKSVSVDDESTKLRIRFGELLDESQD